MPLLIKVHLTFLSAQELLTSVWSSRPPMAQGGLKKSGGKFVPTKPKSSRKSKPLGPKKRGKPKSGFARRRMN